MLLPEGLAFTMQSVVLQLHFQYCLYSKMKMPYNSWYLLFSMGDCTGYGNMGKAFIKTNSPLPRKAAHERLLSTAGMTLCSRRCKMIDNLFDQMVL
jgi:hypothetical protein